MICCDDVIMTHHHFITVIASLLHNLDLRKNWDELLIDPVIVEQIDTNCDVTYFSILTKGPVATRGTCL